MNRKAIGVVFGIIALLTVALIFVFGSKDKTYKQNTFAMDTVIDISITGKNPQKVTEEITNCLKTFETNNSMYKEGSFVDRINKSAGKSSVAVEKETFDLLKRAYDLSEKSNGKFDLTVGPLVKAWSVSSTNPQIPEINGSLLGLINYKDVSFDEATLSVELKKSGQLIDLGGIAKGAVSDKVLQLLEKNKVKEAVISLGGNVIVYGDRTFNVGIRHPRKTGEVIVTVKQGTGIVSTTGDYERFFEVNGKRYHHILDVKTGYPYDGDFYSVSVMGNDGALNDYLSTLLFMTPKEELVKLLDEYQIIAVGKDGQIYASKGLDIEILDKEYVRYKGE